MTIRETSLTQMVSDVRKMHARFKYAQRMTNAGQLSESGHQFLAAGQYQAGLDLAAQLPPGPTTEYLAGRCHFGLGQFLSARDHLTLAVQGGCEPAHVDLVRALRYTGESAAARAHLDRYAPDVLSEDTRLRLLLERGQIDLFDGWVEVAHQHFMTAWTQCSAHPDRQQTRTIAARLLASSYAQLGQYTPARHYLAQALQDEHPAAHLLARHTQARMALDAGDFGAAERALNEAATLLPRQPFAAAMHDQLRGVLHAARGRWPDAELAFCHARERARANGELGTECLAALGHACILIVLRRWAEAPADLLRALRQSPNAYFRALAELRLATWHVARGEPQGLTLLDSAQTTFTRLNLQREVAWCELHRSAASWPDRPAAEAALDRAMNIRFALGAPVLLTELRLQPGLLPLLNARAPHPAAAALLNDRRAAFPHEPAVIELRTLGRSAVLVDGQEVRLGMRRTTELLAYLILRGPATRAHLLSTLWGDVEPRRAANYFHQAKHELTQHLPWLKISLDRQQGTYRLVSEGPLVQCDLQITQRALSAEHDDEVVDTIRSLPGPFLPDVDTPWVREERDALEWSIMRSALRLMQRWSEQGDYQRCIDLSTRLLDFNPCDEALVEYLVIATLELEGLAAAQRTLQAAAQRAQQELGLRPDWEQRLMDTLRPLPN